MNTGGSIAGWTVTDGSVDHGAAPAQTTCQSAGGQCVDLNGNGPGTISQAFDTSCKPMFRVSFFLSRHKVLDATPATMIALVDGVQVKSFSHSAAGVTATDGKWQAEGFDVTANGPTSTLAFRSAGVSAPDCELISGAFVYPGFRSPSPHP